MKATALTAPLIVAAMMFGGVWALGTLTMKSSMISTKGSLELLKLHVKVAQMHDALVAHSKESVDEHLEAHSAQLDVPEEKLTETASLNSTLSPIAVGHARYVAMRGQIFSGGNLQGAEYEAADYVLRNTR